MEWCDMARSVWQFRSRHVADAPKPPADSKLNSSAGLSGLRSHADVKLPADGTLARPRPPRQVIRQHVDRDRRQTHHHPDPENRRVMNSPPVASGSCRLHWITLVY